MKSKNILDFPSRIVIELTPRCNLSCPMCPRNFISMENVNISEQLFKKLLHEILVENPQAIILPFWRGESCLHPQFLELMNYALDQGARLHLSSNGHFMGQEFMDVFYRCEFMTFSLHTEVGFRNAVKYIQNKPDWSTVVSQVSFVRSEKSAGTFLQDCVASDDLMGFDSVRLYEDHTTDGVFGKRLDEDVVERNFCDKLNHTFVVGAGGGYSRCNHVWRTTREPNMNERTIKEVWDGEVMQRIRTDYPDETCLPCDQWSGHTCGEVWRRAEGQAGIVHRTF